jgi:PilZ domain-containing protein
LTTLCRAGGSVVPFSAIGNTLVKATQDDGRTSARRRVLKAAIAASNDRHITVACTLRDLSTTGARLRVDSSLGIPDTFELIIEVDGLEANCEVVWRKGNEVGARFLGAPRIVAAKRTQIITPLVPPKAPTLRRSAPGTSADSQRTGDSLRRQGS